MRLACRLLDALLAPEVFRSLDVSFKQAYNCDAEQGLAQLQAMAQEAPIQCARVP